MNLIKSKDFYAPLVYFLISSAFVLLNLVWFLPTTRELRKNVTALELEVAMRAHSRIESFLEEKEKGLEITSRFLNRYNLRDPLNGIAVANILKDSYFNNAFLTDKQGQEIFKVDRFKTVFPSELRDLSGTAEFKSAIGSGKIFFGEIRFSEKLEPISIVAFPVFISEGEIAGVLGVELNVKTVFDEISDIRIGERGQVYMVDKNGILISHRDISLILKKTDYSSRKVVADIVLGGRHFASADDDTYLYVNEDGEKVLAVARHIEVADWIVVFEESKNKALIPLRTVQIFDGLIVLAGLIALLVLRRINSKLQLTLKDSKEKRERLNAIIFSMSEGLLLIDGDYKIILINNKAENLLGVSAGEAIGKNVKEIITALKGNEVIVEEEWPVVKMFRTGQAIAIDLEDDFYYQSPSGRKFPVGLTVSPLRGDGTTGAIMVFRDIAREKNLDKAKTEFISLASHQLRTPLTSIKWIADLLRAGDLGTLNQKQEEYISDLYSSVQRMIDLVNGLLNVARIESVQLGMKPVPIDLETFYQGVIKEFQPTILAKEHAVIFKKEVSTVTTDYNLLSEILRNLLSNAIKYTPQKGKIEIKVSTENSETLFMIKDSGLGIPSDERTKVFQKFFRGSNVVRVSTEGTGLGLYIVKNLVELLGGKIWFESEQDKGVTFYFTLPSKGPEAKKGEKELAHIQ